MNTNTSFVVRNKNARTLRLIGEKIIQLASLAERADEVGRPLEVEGGLMLHENFRDWANEVVYVLQVGESEMRITVDTHTLELVGRKGFYMTDNVMPEPRFELGNVESPYDAAVKHFADVGFSPARYSDVVSDGGMDPRNAPAPAQDDQQPVEQWQVRYLLGQKVEERWWQDSTAERAAWCAEANAQKLAKGLPDVWEIRKFYTAPIVQSAPAQESEHHARLLGQALGECIAAAGIIQPDASLSGPELLMFADDLKRHLAEQAAPQDAPYAPGIAEQLERTELSKLRAVVSSVAAEQFHILPWSHPHCMCSRCDLIREARDALSQQVTPQKYDDVLLPFLDLMRTELRANSGKGDRAGWLSMSRETCLLEIHYHLAKLQKATLEDAPSGIREHAADVANMSMMLVDICGLLIERGGDQ